METSVSKTNGISLTLVTSYIGAVRPRWNEYCPSNQCLYREMQTCDKKLESDNENYFELEFLNYKIKLNTNRVR